LVYSHHHADHAGAANLFGDDVIRIGHEDTRRLLLRDSDPTRPAPDVTFQDTFTLKVGGERVELAFHGPSHSPDSIFMHFPDHDALMLVDIVNPGWVPIYNCNLSEDIPGYIDAPGQALAYPWQHYIGGHLGRLGTRADIELHEQYINDIIESSKDVLSKVDPTQYYVNAWPNMWAGVKGHLSAVTELATKPVVAKYTGVLAAADVEELTYSTTFMIMQSMRLDLGAGSQVHP
jgi:glyoxylase-like metal-dependent hydrolase (beta-lactamase superfamily II)